MKYRSEIDGLRAVAVLPVILFHAGFELFSGGYVGVDVFFVISGYLITSIVFGEVEQGSFTLTNFYERRARRILPALFCVILCSFVPAWLWMWPGELQKFSESMAAVSVFSSNIFFFMQKNYFAAASEELPLLHTWSLAVEEQFYLFFPPLVLLIFAVARRWLVALLVLGVLASMGLSEWLWRTYPNANFFLLPSRAWELLIGSLAAVYLRNQGGVPQGNQAASLLGLVMISLSVFAYDEATPFPSLYTILPVVGTMLIVLFADRDVLVGRLLSWKPLVAVGLISYSVYLWHQPVFAFARIRGGDTSVVWLSLVLVLVSVALGWLSWKFVETPFRDRRRFDRRQVFTISGIGTLALLVFGLAGSFGQGFPGRFDAADADLLLPRDNRTAYIVERYNRFVEKEQFAGDGQKRKLLLVGDSFSQDFVNVLGEMGKLDSLDLLVEYVPVECQFYSGDEDVGEHIERVDQPKCEKAAAVLRQMPAAEADLIVLAFMWRDWGLERLEPSIASFLGDATVPVVVMGRKHFGRVNLKELYRVPVAERGTHRLEASATQLDTNRRASAAVDTALYVDLHELICGDAQASSCPIFDEQGRLLSHDGGHLTRAGAEYVAQRLLRNEAFVAALDGR